MPRHLLHCRGAVERPKGIQAVQVVQRTTLLISGLCVEWPTRLHQGVMYRKLEGDAQQMIALQVVALTSGSVPAVAARDDWSTCSVGATEALKEALYQPVHRERVRVVEIDLRPWSWVVRLRAARLTGPNRTSHRQRFLGEAKPVEL